MLIFGRMILLMLVGLTVVYVCLFFYLRSGAKMQLEEDWVMEGRPGDRDDWIDDRLAPRARRIRNRLVIAVYALPIVALSGYVWITNS